MVVNSQLQPSLIYYSSENEYYKHFCRMYCDSNKPIYTFDNIRVDFYPRQFNHAFYESIDIIKSDKLKFSRKRAERIDWIKWALENQNAILYQGWDKKKKSHNSRRRVCVTDINYIVVIQLKSAQREAFFITAFLADTPRTLQQIMSNPKWVS